MITPLVQQLIELALAEDLSAGDATTDAVFDPDQRGQGILLAKTPLVLSGREIFEAVFRRVDPRCAFSWRYADGDSVPEHTILADLEGPVASILKAERTGLNFLQRMSGVATQTRRYVDALAGTQAVVTDTRKTLPGWRLLDKQAVRAGGARNHRYDLGGGVMLKDNHIAAAGSIAAAAQKVRLHAPHTLRVEIEVTNLDELDQAVDAGADIILLDNMDDALLALAIPRARARAGARPLLLEASGGITLERLPALAALGVDLISVGALTHSVKAADISLDLR
jgi:nicotinate-nucleotide pyrophosphorylase (carboxylating)